MTNRKVLGSIALTAIIAIFWAALGPVQAQTDAFSRWSPGLTTPADHAFVVTPNDGVPLSYVCRALYVGGAGDVKVDMNGGETAVPFNGVPAGTTLPIRPDLVYSTDTTATSIVCIY